MDSDIFLTLIFGVVTVVALIIGGAYWIYDLYKKCEKEKEENKKLNESLKKLYEEYDHRELDKIRELLIEAVIEIRICGLVGYQPIHQCSRDIVNSINNCKVRVRILIADPDSDYFNIRVKKEEDKIGRLILEHEQALNELKFIYANIIDEYKDYLKVKLYQSGVSDVSFWISDNNEMFVNEFNKKNGLRCYYSPMYKISNQRLAQQISFKHYNDLFEHVLNDVSSKSLNLKSLLQQKSDYY